VETACVFIQQAPTHVRYRCGRTQMQHDTRNAGKHNCAAHVPRMQQAPSSQCSYSSSASTNIGLHTPVPAKSASCGPQILVEVNPCLLLFARPICPFLRHAMPRLVCAMCIALAYSPLALMLCVPPYTTTHSLQSP
jgi:hypothetical protein